MMLHILKVFNTFFAAHQVYDILRADKIIIEASALKYVQEFYSGSYVRPAPIEFEPVAEAATEAASEEPAAEPAAEAESA